MFSGRIGTEPAPRPGRQQMEKAAKGEISCQDQCEIGFSFLGGRPRRGQGCDGAWKKSGLAAVCVLENSRGARSSWVASRTFLPSHAATSFVCLREASLKRMDGLLELKRPGGDGRKGPKKKPLGCFRMSQMHSKWILGNAVGIASEVAPGGLRALLPGLGRSHRVAFARTFSQ